jgi:hypothetical protein
MTRRLLVYCGGADSAGTGYALKHAIDAYGDGWEARAVRRKNSWLDYPADVTWEKFDSATGRVAQQLFDEADLVQIMQVPRTARVFRGWRRKPMVVTQIGTYLRNDPEGVSDAVREIGAVQVVNSLELLNLAPDAELLLWTVDLDLLGRMREEHRREPDGRIRIYHSPTNREIKSTAAFLAATERLAKRHPIDVELVEGVPWMENLRRKAAADIVFDEVKLGYGLNSAEAWAMRIPALVGLIDPGAREMFMDRYGGFPYPDTTEDTIEERLEELIISAEAREHWADVGYRFVQENHAESVVAPQTVALYERILAERGR